MSGRRPFRNNTLGRLNDAIRNADLDALEAVNPMPTHHLTAEEAKRLQIIRREHPAMHYEDAFKLAKSGDPVPPGVES